MGLDECGLEELDAKELGEQSGWWGGITACTEGRRCALLGLEELDASALGEMHSCVLSCTGVASWSNADLLCARTFCAVANSSCCI